MEQTMNSEAKPRAKKLKEPTGLTVRDASGIAMLPPALDIVRNMARLGHPVPSIAAALGVSRETFNQCRKRQPEVDEAFAQGRAGLEHELASGLVKAAREGNIVAAIFALKSMFGYRDNGQTDTAPKVAVQINLPAAMEAKAYSAMIEAERKGEAGDE
tara:strand:+ start:1971 stop:2444 length:474 start_codon:yes stop_codon:yes gene_type:complete